MTVRGGDVPRSILRYHSGRVFGFLEADANCAMNSWLTHALANRTRPCAILGDQAVQRGAMSQAWSTQASCEAAELRQPSP